MSDMGFSLKGPIIRPLSNSTFSFLLSSATFLLDFLWLLLSEGLGIRPKVKPFKNPDLMYS